MDPNIVSEILVSSKMGPSQVLFQRLNMLVSSFCGPNICMFQIMKLGELQCGPKHCFGNLGELQNGPKMYSSYQIWENSKKGPMARVVSEIEYLGELLSGPKICFRY